MKTLLILLSLALSSCSIVQWLPSSNCQHVKYERLLNHVSVSAECEV